MPFKPGDPKPPGSGRKKGVKNKSKTGLAKSLKAKGADIEVALAKAIREGNLEMIKTLTALLPYVFPRLSPQKVAEDTDVSKAFRKAKTPDERAKIIRDLNLK